jgi:hypothetical protein
VLFSVFKENLPLEALLEELIIRDWSSLKEFLWDSFILNLRLLSEELGTVTHTWKPSYSKLKWEDHYSQGFKASLGNIVRPCLKKKKKRKEFKWGTSDSREMTMKRYTISLAKLELKIKLWFAVFCFF